MSDALDTYLLPPAAYTEESWLRAEQEALFERTWTFAGVAHDLGEPGDVVTVQVGRVPVVVVRGEDGALQAFHNLCRHRGHPLVDGDRNCGKALICPYHRWSYGLDGALRAVPQRDRYPALDLAALALRPVRVETWKTLVFVHLDPDPEPLDEWMADLESLFANFHPERLVEVSDQTHDVEANWKLYVENHVDWLHLWYLHDDSLRGYDHAGGERHEFGRHWASFETWTADGGHRSVRDDDADEEVVLLPIPGLAGRERDNGAHLVFPGLTLFTNAGYWMLGQVVPVDATRFRLRLRVFAVEGSNGPAFEDIVNVVMFEDYAATEAIQRALRAPSFAVGPIATDYEREIARFHRHYLEFVTPPTSEATP